MELKQFLNQNLTDYAPVPFWSWNDNLKADELRRQIRAMKKAGMGGFFMHARGGLETEYMGDDWFDVTCACIDEARKQGMNAWCYDENGWPSGFAGMKLLEDSANWAHYIVCEEKNSFDDTALAVYALEGTAIRRLHPGDNAAAYICIYDRTNNSVVDILNPDVVDKFIAKTHEQYYARFGDDFGGVLKGFFTDEPQYFRWDTAYTPIILEAYRERYGEDLLDILGALFIECDQAHKLRYRYWKLMNHLYTENFAGRIYRWCEAHNCMLTGHSIEERNIDGQMLCCAGIMPFYEYEHIPGIDWLGREIGTEAAPKQVGSAAAQLGKKHVITETFGCAGWDVTPRELKRITEWQYVNGVNMMCHHLYPYSIRGQRKRDYPAFYSNHNPWVASDLDMFNAYFTRLGAMLAESREIAEVAVIHPIHSAYFTYKRNGRDTVKALDDSFNALIEQLGAANIGHHYVDETLLDKYGCVNGDNLVMGKCAYRYVIIPEMDGLDANTANLLRRYVQNGGKLYLAGKAPRYIDGEAVDLDFLRSNISFNDMINPDARINRHDTEIRSTLHEGEFGRFLYAVNLSKDKTYSVEWTLNSRGAKLFDLQKDEYAPLYFESVTGGVRVPLSFEPGQSYVVLVDDGAVSSQGTPASPKCAVLLPNEAQIVSRSDNALTIDYASISYDGENFETPLPIMAVSDRMLRERRNGKLFLKYTFTVAEIPSSIRLEREHMNACRAWFNGENIEFDKSGVLDASFIAADIVKRIHVGENELIVEIDYYQPEEVYSVFNGVYYDHDGTTESLVNCLSYATDLEAIYLLGDFGVSAEPFIPGIKHTLITDGGFAITQSRKRAAMNELAREGFPFFAGHITFEVPFTARGDETTLTIGGRYALCKVSINGSAEKTLLFENHMSVAGLLKPGENVLTLTLYSANRNIYGPFHIAYDPEPNGIGPDSFSNYGHWQNGENPIYTSKYAFVYLGVDAIELA